MPATIGFVDARVDAKAFAQFLTGYQFSSQHVLLSTLSSSRNVAGITRGKALSLFVLHDEVALTFYVPLILD
jgi:hypothetical protein